MADGGRVEIDERSTPVAGPLGVTPLYRSSADTAVWWDGTSWNQTAATGGGGGIILTDPSSLPTHPTLPTGLGALKAGGLVFGSAGPGDTAG